MSSFKFHLRFSSSLEEKERRLFVRVIHERKARCLSTAIQLFPQEWDVKNQKIITTGASPKRKAHLTKLDQEIKAISRGLESIISKLEKEGFYAASNIVELYQRHKSGSELLLYVDKLSSQLIDSGQCRTARAYRSTADRFISFIGNKQFRLKGITARLLVNFETSLRKEGKSANTISFYMRNLRAIYNKGVKENIFEPEVNNPFNDVYTGISQTRKRSLTKEEMTLLNNANIKNINDDTTSPFTYSHKSLQQALDLFLFSFYARGMSFVDMAYLRKEDLQDGVITYRRKKTDQVIELKVTSAMKAILKRFSPQTKNSTYLLPIITNKNVPERLQYESALRLQNKRLKILSSFFGLKKELSTHMARHSWASLAKLANLPTAVISEGLGHTSEKTTTIYLSSFDRPILDNANDIVIQMVSSPKQNISKRE